MSETRNTPPTPPFDAEEAAAEIARLRAELADCRQAGQALRRSEERFRTLLREVNDVAWTAAGEEMRMRYINQACERVYGRPAAEFIANPNLWSEVIHPEDSERVLQEVTTLRTAGELSQEYRIQRPDGEIRWLSDRKFMILDAAGEPVLMGGLATDITDRIEARQELEAKNQELERFTYTVSHDLRSPLVTIAGFLVHLEKDLEEGDHDRVRQDIAHIRDAADQMRQLIGELLDLSRIGRLAGEPQRVSLSELAATAVEVLAGQLEEAAATVVVDDNLPTILGDRTRWLQVFQNLVENALKFRADGRPPRVEVGMRRDGDEAVVFVRDNGQGIAAEHRENVFGLFRQLHARTEGTGIGLALVRRIVEVHGGRIWVESEGIGHGSTFCFTLPSDEDT